MLCTGFVLNFNGFTSFKQFKDAHILTGFNFVRIRVLFKCIYSDRLALRHVNSFTANHRASSGKKKQGGMKSKNSEGEVGKGGGGVMKLRVEKERKSRKE